MPEYRRPEIAGGTFFFTVVTFNRLPILTGDTARKLLHFAWLDTAKRFPFITHAGTRIETSIASKMPAWGTNGGWPQIELLQRIPGAQLGKTTSLGK